MRTMSLKDIQQNYNFSYNTAKAAYQRTCKEFQQPELTYRGGSGNLNNSYK